MEGTCKFFLSAKRYGFISIHDENGRELADFHFHASAVLDNEPPRKGDGVTFWLDRDRRRGNLVASEVRVIA
jgi:cold shock CspA family protein